MQAKEQDVGTLSDAEAEMVKAAAMAADDAALMAALQERENERADAEMREALAAENAAIEASMAEPEPAPKMNRAERRAQVKAYAKLLTMTERQTPVRNATIIPKTKRRRKRR